jgi:hypothetical protein
MFENHTGSSRTVASSWLLPGLGGRGWPRARESGLRGEGTDRSTKTWNHLETMPEGIDQALAKSGKSWPIYLNSKPAMGTSTHTINTLFKRKSRFKPKSQECSTPECQSRLVAPHQEPFAPMFENHTGSSHEPLRVRGCSPGLGGRKPGSLVSGERARIAPQRHGIISRQCQRE